MNMRERFLSALNGQPVDRLPRIEWATWWNQTLTRWRDEGLPGNLNHSEIKRFFGLDMDYQLWFGQSLPELKKPAQHSDGYCISSMADYERIVPKLYPRNNLFDQTLWKSRAGEQQRGDAIIWITLSGFFWWPRELFGVEPHLFAFYDHPEIMHRICRDQADHMLRCLDAFSIVCIPDFMTFAEDMSYNHGPMLSKELFDEFLAPYYRRVIPRLKELGIAILVDSDGDVEPMIPWLEEVGIEGILPLERMAGVDINRIRRNHPKWKMIGGFDKLVMHRGEAAMRAEFERILPTMRSGYYIPSVDHQTPPAVSMTQYRQYLELLDEYIRKAAMISV